jgi:hypothetical protein
LLRATVVAGGRVAIVTGEDETVVLAIHDDRLHELGRIRFHADCVGTVGDRVVLDGNPLVWLDGLEAAVARSKPPAWKPPALPAAKVRLDAPPRWTAVMKGTDDTDVTFGKVTVKVPCDPAELAQIVPSPGGTRFLAWAVGYSGVRAFDRATGELLGEWTDDQGSGMMADACWLDEDHLAFAHWEARICKIGVEEPIGFVEERATSIAAAPVAGKPGTFRLALVVEPDLDAPQRLVVHELRVGKGDAVKWGRSQKPMRLPERLATVRRAGDAIVLLQGGKIFKI